MNQGTKPSKKSINDFVRSNWKEIKHNMVNKEFNELYKLPASKTILVNPSDGSN